MKIFTGIKNIIDLVLKWVCIALLAVMTVLVVYQVFARQVLRAPAIVTEIASQYMFVWLVFLGGSYLFGLREHIAVTILKDKYPPIINMVVEILIHLALLVFSATVLINGGTLYTINQMGTLDAALQIPFGIISSVLPISGYLIMFYSVYNMLLAIKEYRDGNGQENKAGTTL